jgi:hypothetical protein
MGNRKQFLRAAAAGTVRTVRAVSLAACDAHAHHSFESSNALQPIQQKS